jgi:hypothetical protein
MPAALYLAFSWNATPAPHASPTAAACGALQDKNLMAQRQDFSLQGRTGTQTDESKRQKMSSMGKEGRLQATVTQFNWFNQNGVFARNTL